VSEAFNLLNKSIIRVEQPDVNLDDDEDDLLNEIPETADGKFIKLILLLVLCSIIKYYFVYFKNIMLFRNGC